jgi:hypothetical protein
MEIEDYIILVLFFVIIIQLSMKRTTGKCGGGGLKGGYRM